MRPLSGYPGFCSTRHDAGFEANGTAYNRYRSQTVKAKRVNAASSRVTMPRSQIGLAEPVTDLCRAAFNVVAEYCADPSNRHIADLNREHPLGVSTASEGDEVARIFDRLGIRERVAQLQTHFSIVCVPGQLSSVGVA